MSINSLAATVCFYCADQNPHRDRSRGITAYSAALLRCLQARRVRLQAIVSRSSFAVPAGIERVHLPFRTDNGTGRLLADHFHALLPAARKTDATRIWHYPKGFLPLTWQARGPRIGTVADMILPYYHDKYPESRHWLSFAYWLRVLRHSIERLDLILTVSEFSRRAIAEYAADQHLRCPPIINTYEGVEAPLITLSDIKKQDSVLHLASTLPHKGTRWLLQSWQQLQGRGKDLPALVLVGEMDASSRHLLAGLEHVTWHPPMARTALEQQIAEARALLLPSEIEGFGLPAVEAYLCGTPTAYVRGTAVAEVLGAGTPGGFELDMSPDSLQQALAELLAMSPEATAAKAAELRARYAWELCTDRTLAAYQSVLA
jgi:glycosyltransferase involved in cell wall biosynthesis